MLINNHVSETEHATARGQNSKLSSARRKIMLAGRTRNASGLGVSRRWRKPRVCRANRARRQPRIGNSARRDLRVIPIRHETAIRSRRVFVERESPDIPRSRGVRIGRTGVIEFVDAQSAAGR